MRTKTPEQEVDALVSQLDLEQWKLFQLFAIHGSFSGVGTAASRASNTVRDRMLAASKVFESVFGHALLDVQSGHYELTVHGRYIAESYGDVTEFLGRLIKRYRSTRRVYEIPCTLNTLDDFYRLAHVLRENASFELYPDPKRTADLQVHELLPGPSRISFGSILASELPQSDVEGEPCTIAPHISMLAFSCEPLFLLGRKTLGLGSQPDIAKALENGITLLMPQDGVAWMFAQLNSPHWDQHHPHLHVPIPHRDFGFEMLRHEDRAAMVVHGDISDFLRANPDMQALQLHERNGMKHHAFTGMVIDRRVDMDEGHFEVILKAAKGLFQPGCELKGR